MIGPGKPPTFTLVSTRPPRALSMETLPSPLPDTHVAIRTRSRRLSSIGELNSAGTVPVRALSI